MSNRIAAKRKLQVVTTEDAWPGLWASFERSMDAADKSKRTLAIYADGARTFHKWSLANNLPTDPAKIEKEQIERFVIWLRQEGSQKEGREGQPVSRATVRARFSALRRFFNWCVEEEIIEHSPMARMSGPRVPVEPQQPLSEAELNALLKACDGRSFEDRRDTAIISLMLDSGLRRGEVANIMLEDMDLKNQVVKVTRKGGRVEFGSFGKTTASDIDRYLRARDRHPQHETTVERNGVQVHPLWLAQKGGLTGDGVHFVIKHRARQAGLTRRVWPHLMRHTFAHSMKARGASDEDLMTAGGWRDPKIMQRYGAGARFERSHATVQRLSLRDRLK